VRRPLLVLTLLVLAAWSGAIVVGGLAYDDREVLEGNPAIDGSAGWGAVFGRDYWAHHPAGAAGHYRPLATASLRLDRSIHGASARGLHLTNVLLHLAVVLLAAALFRVRDRRLPLVGLALFAVHPALADSVAWISGRTSMISAAVGLAGAWLVAWRARRADHLGVALGAALAGLGATLGKEDGLVFALLAVLLALERGRRWVPAAVLGCAVGLALYGFMRHFALGQWLPASPHAVLADVAWPERLRIAGGAGLEGLRVALWPIHYPPQWDLADFVDTPIAAATLAWALLATALVWGSLRAGCDAAAGLALGAAALLPVAQLIPSGELLAPRFLYLPLLFAAPAVHSLWRATGRRRGVVAVVLGLCVVLAWQRAGVYSSRASYWLARGEWRWTPQVWNALGNAHLEQGRGLQATAAWERALELDPDYPKAWVNLATDAMRREEWSAAARDLGQALRLEPSNAAAWANLGRVRGKLGLGAEAVEAYEHAVEASPGAAPLWRGLARARWARGDRPGAGSAIGRALELAPADPMSLELKARIDAP
jgi:protein O-mannosyl-transferase